MDIVLQTYRIRLLDLGKIHPREKDSSNILSFDYSSYWMNVTFLWIDQCPDDSNDDTNEIIQKLGFKRIFF